MPGIRRAVASAVLLAAAVVAATPAATQGTRPTPQFETTTKLAVALRAKQLADVMTLLAADAVIMPSFMPLVGGRTDTEDALKRLFSAASMELRIVSVGSGSSESLGYDSGTYEVVVATKAGTVVRESGSYVALQRLVDGQWRIVQLIWTPSGDRQTTTAPSHK